MKVITLVLLLFVYVDGSMPSERKFVRWINSHWPIKRAKAAASYNATNDVKFHLFTRMNRANGQQIKLDDVAALRASHFDVRHPTRFTIHGWKGHGKSQSNQVICDAYLSRGDFNMITVDWAAGAKTINYYRARQRVKETGRTVANFIKFLEMHAGLNLDSLTLVGHSLGAHVAGFAGKYTHGQINTIFGLDPAGPLFSLKSKADRLSDSDAKYVETIVTDGGYLGMFGKIGNATFFPNGGKLQPGCTGRINKYRCAHRRAYYLFAESVKRNESEFVAEKCANITDIAEKRLPQRRNGSEDGRRAVKFRKSCSGCLHVVYAPKEPVCLGQADRALIC